MKLIDLLVQELPKRGGWSDEWVAVSYDSNNNICAHDKSPTRRNGFGWTTKCGDSLCEKWKIAQIKSNVDWADGFVAREQYEAALAASQQPAWSGEGLPPVGTECEAKKQARHNENIWVRVKIMYMSEFTAVMKELEVGATGEQIHHPRTLDFRPIRTEADRKRDEAISAMMESLGHSAGMIEVANIYRAIASGKIPGVKLE